MVLQIVLQCLTRCSFKGKNSIRLHRLSYNDGMYVYNDQTFSAQWSLPGGGGVGVLPYIGYAGMCRWKGHSFQAIYSGMGSSNHRKLV